MKDLSVVIAHKGDPLGLWATIQACSVQLAQTSLEYEFLICVNGEKDCPTDIRKPGHFISGDTHRLLHFLGKAGKLGYAKILQRDVSPPTARQYAAERATGRIIAFFDNHCLPAPNYFTELMRTFRENDVDMVHSTTKYYDADATHYHYNIKFDTTFWAESSFERQSEKEWLIAAGGHGGYAVTAESWHDVGGYWKGFTGYAGEELTTDLQYWMRGKRVMVSPTAIHYHWAGRRAYRRHYTDDYYRNLMMSAHIIGGEKYLWNTYQHFTKSTKAMTGKSMYDLLEEAYYRSRDEAKRLASVRIMDLDELRQHFVAAQIAH